MNIHLNFYFFYNNYIVYIDDDKFTPDLNGLNFAVFDNELKKIVAAQTYDTSVYQYTCTNTTAFYGEILIEE